MRFGPGDGVGRAPGVSCTDGDMSLPGAGQSWKQNTEVTDGSCGVCDWANPVGDAGRWVGGVELWGRYL